MKKLYNTQNDITSNLRNILKKIIPNIRKTQLNIIPEIIFGMIMSEYVITSDISFHLKDNFSLNLHDSNNKRIYRFLNNKLFNPYEFYENIIKYVISNFKAKHKDNHIHISLDHMFVKEKFTVIMFSLRIGNQGIPLWYRCFKGKFDESSSLAFQDDLIIEGINFYNGLFSSKNFKIIFLADRWFGNHFLIMKHIDYLNQTYVFRTRSDVKIFTFDKKENHKIWKTLDDLKPIKYHSKIFQNAELTNKKYTTNLIISKYDKHNEAWYLLTNSDHRRAVKDYGYRFGTIETIFKNQKSNGFYLEDTKIKNLSAFTTLYSLLSFSVLFLYILGVDYSKNSHSCYKNNKISNISRYKNGIVKRSVSFFHLGLILFKYAFNSLKYVRIPFKLVLYDI